MPRIPQETLERIAAANDIVEVVGTYIPLKRAGSTFRANCPFHQEKTPSFHVNPSRQTYHCFGCGAHGTVFRFLMEHEHLDFVSVVRRLAERAGIPLTDIEFSAEEDANLSQKRRLLALHEAATVWFHRLLLRNDAAAHARDYLKSRGLNKDIAVSWRIGYAPNSWDAFTNHAKQNGFTAAELRTSGLVKLRDEDNPNSDFYDRFRDRLMFPICDREGQTIAFSGRVLNPTLPGGKYINSPETPLFVKGNVLFGLNKSKRAMLDSGSAIVCEGQIDMITAFEHGVKNVIASQGTAFTERQAQLLKLHAEEVILCFDSDAAGQQAAERSLPALLANNLIVRVAVMPEGEDPDSTIRKHGAEVFSKRIAEAKDFFDFQIDRLGIQYNLDTLRGKMQFARRMVESIVLIKDKFLREAVLNRVAARLGMAADDIRPMLKTRRGTEAAAEAIAEKENSVELPSPSNLLACHTVLRHADARAWFLQQPWRPILDGMPDCQLLARILDANPGTDLNAINAFLATLAPEEEAALGQILEAQTTDPEKKGREPLTVMKDWWRELVERDRLNRRKALEARLREPGLSEGEMMSLLAQIQSLSQQAIQQEKDRQGL